MQNNLLHCCPLCGSVGKEFYKNNKRKCFYYQCNNCYGIFINKKLILNKEAEMLRYQEHNNDVEDRKYQEFVSPITSAILRDFTQNNKGLDFGAGTGPVIAKVLKDSDYNIIEYDPFFHNYPELLEKKYDYIACCEVIEHFRNPKKEFVLLKKLLTENGMLYCMTSIYNENIDFHNWRYKNDQTHIFIYHNKTIQWIKEKIGFLNVRIEGRLITFSG